MAASPAFVVHAAPAAQVPVPMSADEPSSVPVCLSPLI
jgi:hypothetical protein